MLYRIILTPGWQYPYSLQHSAYSGLPDRRSILLYSPYDGSIHIQYNTQHAQDPQMDPLNYHIHPRMAVSIFSKTLSIIRTPTQTFFLIILTIAWQYPYSVQHSA
jgi:hypothetical protein